MLKNLGLAAISLLFALFVSEILLRVFYEPPARVMDHFRLTKSSSYRADSDLGWLPRPNVQAEHNRQGSFESWYSTNSLGLRDREHSMERTPALTRIVVVGDSFAWGYGVSDGEIFTDILERLVPNFEVVNLGVTAYGLPQEIAYFQRLGIKFDPDVLAVALAQNDIYEPPDGTPDAAYEDNPAAGEAGSEPDSDNASWFRLAKQYLGNEVVIYGLLVDATNRNPALVDLLVRVGLKENLAGLEALDPNIGTALREYPPVIEIGWEKAFTQLRGLKAYTDENDIRLIIALVPALQSVDPRSLAHSISYTEFRSTDFEVEKPYAMIEAFGAETGIEVINPLPAFVRVHKAGEGLYLYGDMHFNAAGHQLFAEEIARYLVQ